MSEKYLDKIAKLLVQAERASTPEEADAYLAAAQRIASTTQIDLAIARAHSAKREQRSVPLQRSIHIGKSGTRLLYTYVQLALAIARANDVKCDIARNSTVVYAYGYPEDIEVVERLYSSLVVQMVQASNEYIRSGAYKSETVYRPGRWRKTGRRDRWGDSEREWVDGGQAPVHGTTARKSFQEAFASKVGHRLRAARQEAIEAAKEAEIAGFSEDELRNYRENLAVGGADGKTGTELALVAKEIEVADYYKQTSNARGSYRGGRAASRSSYSSHASEAGREAGSRARLGGEKAIAS